MQPRQTLINTPLQRGEQRGHETGNRFNGFDTLRETAEAVHPSSRAAHTPLKRGVNDSGNFASRGAYETSGVARSVLFASRKINRICFEPGYRLSLILTLLTICTAPALLAQNQPTPSSSPATSRNFYHFVNATRKFTDDQISWSFSERGPYTTFAQAKNAPPKLGGGGRMYFKIEAPGAGGKPQVYKDFIEFTHNGTGWYGNTTQVDEFVIPLTIELFQANGTSQKCGINESRAALFEAFKRDAPREFQSCVKGAERILSPCRADFKKGMTNGNYFDKYIDEVWQMYATEKETPGGWTGKVVDGALIFSKAGKKDYVLHKKPTTQDVFLGQNELGRSPDFCSAINRHVLADPGDWRDASTYYKTEPYNFYAKFFHDHSLQHLAYGFCYDDFNQQASYFAGRNPTKLVVTIYWDTPPGQ